MASEGPSDGGKSKVPKGEGPAEPGTDFWLTFPSVLFLPFLCRFAKYQFVLGSLCHHFLGANVEKSLSCIRAEVSEELEHLLRAPLSDDDEREFLARWTIWRDGRMPVADRIGE